MMTCLPTSGPSGYRDGPVRIKSNELPYTNRVLRGSAIGRFRVASDLIRTGRRVPDGPAGGQTRHHHRTPPAASGGRSAMPSLSAERSVRAGRNGHALDNLIAEIRESGGQASCVQLRRHRFVVGQHTVKDILGQFGHVDYLVNNGADRSRRSVMNSTDRLHDYERVDGCQLLRCRPDGGLLIAALAGAAVRPCGQRLQRRCAGAQSEVHAYNPSKAALDTFSDVVATETLSDHITFTNIHMPLVRTPMIAPSRSLNPQRPISPERAAAMVVRALVDKPARIDHPFGTIAEAGNYLTPKLARRVLHQIYLPVSGLSRRTRRRAVEPGPQQESAAATQATCPRRGPEAARAPGGQARRPPGARRALVSQPSRGNRVLAGD